MPSIDVTVTVTAEELTYLQAWFPTWNAQLTVPYADLQAAIQDHTTHQVQAWILGARPTNIRDAWQEATEAQQEEIRIEVARITGKTIL